MRLVPRARGRRSTRTVVGTGADWSTEDRLSIKNITHVILVILIILVLYRIMQVNTSERNH